MFTLNNKNIEQPVSVGPPIQAAKPVAKTIMPDTNFWGFLTQAGTVAADVFQKYTSFRTTEKQQEAQLDLAKQQVKQGMVPTIPISGQSPFPGVLPATTINTYRKSDDWYVPVAQNTMGKSLPIILVGGASLMLLMVLMRKKKSI